MRPGTLLKAEAVSARDKLELAQFLGISPKTMERRLQSNAWDKAEAYKLDMLLHLEREASEVFGNAERAAQWLASPIPALDNAAPIELLDSVDGYERAKNALLRQAYGMY